MLERSELADNALFSLHDENFAAEFATPELTAQSWFFTGGRTCLSLAGPWRFCVDPHETGLRQRWRQIEPARPEDRAAPWDWDPHQGEEIAVPSCWQMLKERWFHYEGAAWYARDFDRAELPEGARWHLRIGAANYEAMVFLNHRFLGRHRGGSTPFVAELTETLRDGINHLLIRVDNARTADRVPMSNTDWFNYGGLYREVEIFATPRALIRDLFVTLVPGSDFRRIRIEAELEGEAGQARVVIPELDVDLALNPDRAGRANAEIDAAPELWSPDAPRLYDVALEYGGDRVADRVGFREIRREGTGLLLNGQPLYLRGISAHEDDRGIGKCADIADLERRFDHAGELGCNFLRLAHYPHHEAAARMADARGFLLWEEIPVYWAIAFDNPETVADARNQLAELIRRDRNRASVIIWSLGNETADTDARQTFMEGLARLARGLDPTRLLAAACLVDPERLKISDRLAGLVDVIGINEYYGWYEADIGDLARIGANSDPDRPVVISETGADGATGPDAPETGLFSLAYQEEVYRQQIAALERLDFVKGMSPWILYDFRAQRRQNRFQKGWNRKGLIAADKQTKKPAFAVLAAHYRALRARGL